MADAVSGTKRKRSTRKEINYAALGEPTDVELEFERDQGKDSPLSNGEEVDEDVDEDEDLGEGDTIYGAHKVSKAVEQKRRAKKRTKLTVAKGKKVEKPVKTFPFLALPAELRDEIYELALVEPNGLTVVSKTRAFRRTVGRGRIPETGRYYKRRSYRWQRLSTSASPKSIPTPRAADLIPNLLAVNKQIHAEAVGYLYKQPIIVDDTSTLHTFIAAIGPNNRLQLSDLVIRSWGMRYGAQKTMNHASLTMLSGCTNLKSLYLDCTIGWARMPRQLARHIYRDGHYWLEACGAAKGKKDAALDVLRLAEENYDDLRPNGSAWGSTVAPLPSAEAKTLVDGELRKLLGFKVNKTK